MPARCINGFLDSWRYWILAAIVGLYVINVGSHWRPYPDSAAYLLLAESLSEGDGYSISGYPHGKYPPGFPLFLAGMQAVGLGSMFILNLCMCVIALAALAASYYLLREIATPHDALLSILVLASLYELYRLSGAQLTDTPFLFLVSTGCLLIMRGLRTRGICLAFGAVVLLVSCWFRILGIPICLAVAIGLILQAGANARWRAYIASGSLLIGATGTGALLFVRDRVVSSAMTVADSYSAELSAVTDTDPFHWFSQTAVNFFHGGQSLGRFLTAQDVPPLVALPVFWLPIMVGGISIWRKRSHIPILAAAAYLGSILILRVPLARYCLPIAPIIILCLGRGVGIIISHLGRTRDRSAAIVATCALLLIACNLPKDIRLAYRTHHPDWFTLLGREDLYRTADYLRAAPGSEFFVTSRYPNMLSYLSGRNHVPFSFPGLDTGGHASRASETLNDELIGYIVIWPQSQDCWNHAAFKSLRQELRDWHATFHSGPVKVLQRERRPVLQVSDEPSVGSSVPLSSCCSSHVR